VSDWRIRAGLLVALAAALCGFWWAGALDPFAEPERLHRLLAETGVAGPLVWWLAFAALEPFGVPGLVFMIPASLAWPPAVAIALCLAGSVGAGVFAYTLAHWVGPDAIAARLPEAVRRRTERARERPVATAFVVRLVFFLFPPAHWALGVSGIRLVPFVLGSALGFLPWVTVWVLGTRAAAEELERLPLWEGITLAAAASGVGLLVWWWRRRAVRRSAS